MILGRDDVTDELVHFVKGDDDSAAFNVLRSWEREWRVMSEALEMSPPGATVSVRNSTWADRLLAEHDREQGWIVENMDLIGEGRDVPGPISGGAVA